MTLKKHFIASVFILALGLVVSSFALLPNIVSAGWIEQTESPLLNWYSIASDSTGQYLVATINSSPEYIYTSTDGGATWTTNNNSSGQNYWLSVASDSTGNKLVAVTTGGAGFNNGEIYTSTDGGINWAIKTNAGQHHWTSVSSDLTGNKLVATEYDSGSGIGDSGYIHTSIDGGATWTTNNNSSGQYEWRKVVSNSTGDKLIALHSGLSYIHTSIDGGATWTTNNNSSGQNYWFSVASDSTGDKLVAVQSFMGSGYVYTSTDGGNIWIAQEDPGSREWGVVASNYEGNKLIAGATGGYVYTYTPPTPAPTFAGGSGTSQSPYQISTCQQLEDINFTPDDGDTYPFLTDKYFILNNNIDCSMTNPQDTDYDADGTWGDGLGFMPIGETDQVKDSWVQHGLPFYGFFYGNNYTISDLYINRPNFQIVGLFGLVRDDNDGHTSLIRNLNITDADITAYASAGVLAGYIEDSLISHVLVSGEVDIMVESPDMGQSIYAGGLIGQASDSEITNSVSQVNVAGYNNAGGLIGDTEKTNISNSYSTGNVTGIYYAGGLVGQSNNNGTISNSYSIGSVTGEEYVGGLIGYLSYNTGIYSDHVSNSGWYQMPDESSMKGIGATSENEGGAEVTYKETDNTLFYSKTHGVYAQGVEGAWDFTTPIWYEYVDNYPQFTAPEIEEVITPVVHHSHVTGSSSGAIARFQAEQQNLPVTPTTPVITPTPSTTGTPLNLTRTLKLNMKGDDVKALQVYLNTHGFPVSLTGAGQLGNETTFFGPLTKKAVIAFQKANGLVADGIVGPKTLEKMK